MINYVVGNILDSPAQALVNTVNCEGYMGKGLAYQFKLKYPETNVDYIKACKSGKLHIGSIHYYYEKGKYIINFPTKNEWRAPSTLEYIQKGLDELKKLITTLQLTSIAIPPLGSGNGQLNWLEVKQLIEKSLSDININIVVYEPSKYYATKPAKEPKLAMSALVLMQIKQNLRKFNSMRLQKTAYLLNIFSHTNYFKFVKHKYGPYDNAIKIISRDIKAFQEYYGTKNTKEAYQILYNKIVNQSLDEKMTKLMPFIQQSAQYVNLIESDKFLEGITTALYIIETDIDGNVDSIINGFKNWSEYKANKFSEDDIRKYIEYLYDTNVIDKTITGYYII